MSKKWFAGKAARLVLAVGLAAGASAAAGAQTTHASDDMGCYGWFDYVYKSTHDMNFAYYHYLVCRGEAVASKPVRADETPILLPTGPITPAAPGGTGTPIRPTAPGGTIIPINPPASTGPVAGPVGPHGPIVRALP